jgi:hypothetical protein
MKVGIGHKIIIQVHKNVFFRNYQGLKIYKIFLISVDDLLSG